MNITDLFTRLSYGELSNLAMSNEGLGEIVELHQPKIVQFANSALLRLYSRFVLKEKDVIIEMSDAITTYHLDYDYALSNPTPPVGVTQYIIDSEAVPFTEDVVKILTVYDRLANKLELNDRDNENSVFTPTPTSLQVPEPVDGERLVLVYQAKHPPLVLADDTEIELPEVLLDAMTAYIAQLVYSGMNGQEHSAKAAEHLARYEAVCNEVTQFDTVNSSVSTTPHKFDERGFV